MYFLRAFGLNLLGLTVLSLFVKRLTAQATLVRKGFDLAYASGYI